MLIFKRLLNRKDAKDAKKINVMKRLNLAPK